MGSWPEVWISVKNTGKSPALNVSVALRAGRQTEHTEEPSPDDNAVSQNPRLATMIGAETEQEFALGPAGYDVITRENLAQYEPLTNVSGIVEYQTIFGIRRHQFDRDTAFFFWTNVTAEEIAAGVNADREILQEMELSLEFIPGWMTHYRQVRGTDPGLWRGPTQRDD